MTDILSTRQIGKIAEQSASAYLQSQGLTLITSNYHCSLGEIDLIMQDGEFIVFVEVRKRNYDDFGTALESVNLRKQGKIIRSATFYLQQKKLFNKAYCRFDIIIPPKGEGTFEWIKNAFSTEAF